MTSIGAVVLGGDYRGLGIVRSLGRRGIPVWVVHGSEAVARHSRYCRRSIAWRAPLDSAWINFLVDQAAENGLEGWTLFPTSDEAAALVSRHWAALSAHYRLTTPRWDVYSAAADKARVAALADELGLRVPRTWTVRSRAELETLDASFPLVLKSVRRERDNALTLAKGWLVADRSELLAKYDRARTVVPPSEVMIQEWVPGGGEHQYAFGAVCVAGEPRLSIVTRRTRQYPRDFGRASCFVESVDHPAVAREATRLLQALRVDGLVEVEFKEDPTDQSLKILDVNVRVWGWHSMGEAAGVDFSHAAYRLACGEDLETASGAAGIRWARLAMDVPYALADIAARELRIRDYLRTLRRPLVGPVAARDDVRPALVELPLLALRSTRRQWSDRSARRRGGSQRDATGQEANSPCADTDSARFSAPDPEHGPSPAASSRSPSR